MYLSTYVAGSHKRWKANSKMFLSQGSRGILASREQEQEVSSLKYEQTIIVKLTSMKVQRFQDCREKLGFNCSFTTFFQVNSYHRELLVH